MVSSDTAVLAAYGQAVVQALASGSTAYAYPTLLAKSTAGSTVGAPTIDLTSATPYAYTDCSGWVHYVLNTLAPVHDAVLQQRKTWTTYNQTVTDYNGQSVTLNGNRQPWAQANVAHDLFAADSSAIGYQNVPLTSGGFTQLQAGDVLAYSLGIYTDPNSTDAAGNAGLIATGDTGHVMVVTGAGQLVASSVVAQYAPGVLTQYAGASVYAVPVVDSSSLSHFVTNGAGTAGEPAAESRDFSENATALANAPADAVPGGVGSGTIWFVEDTQGQIVKLLFHSSTATSASTKAVAVAAARLSSDIDLDQATLNGRHQLVMNTSAADTTIVGGTSFTPVVENLSGSAGLLVQGDGTLSLNGNSSFSGGITLTGTAGLTLSSQHAAGTGGIRFATGAHGSIMLGAATQQAGSVAGISGFVAGDTLDFAGIAPGALTVTAGVNSATINGIAVTGAFSGLDGSGAATLHLDQDGNGGTRVAIVQGQTATGNQITNNASPTLSGTVGGGETVMLALNGKDLGSTTADANGAWRSAVALPSGLNRVSVTAGGQTRTDAVLVATAPTNGISSVNASSFDVRAAMAGSQNLSFISGTQAVQFADGTLSVGSATQQAFLARLNQGLFGRAGDAGGLSYWNGVLDTGASRVAVAQGYLNSAEYQAANAGQDDAQYVQALYQDMLGRTASDSEAGYWTGQLASGATRADLLAGFADSTEAQSALSGATAHVWVENSAAQSVAQAFQTAFGRLPDLEGLQFWSAAMKGGLAVSGLAQALTGSEEFQSAHAGQSADQIVSAFYANALDRAPGSAELSSVTATYGSDVSGAMAMIASSAEAASHLVPYL